MSKNFNYKETLGMVTTVCLNYVTRTEVKEYFERFNKDKVFSQEEIKEIARELTEGKTRKKLAPPVHIWPNMGKKSQKEKDR